MVAEITTLLGAGTRFEGKLAFEGNVRIEGEFRGEILTEDTLIIGEGAVVHASLHVGTLIMRGGELYGSVVALTAIEVHAPARVRGDLHAPSLFIDKGVAFEGRCRMDSVAGDLEAQRLEHVDAHTSTATQTPATPPVFVDGLDRARACALQRAPLGLQLGFRWAWMCGRAAPASCCSWNRNAGWRSFRDGDDVRFPRQCCTCREQFDSP
jgi:cytoskeletal protein CcmA (bactofilin family)